MSVDSAGFDCDVLVVGAGFAGLACARSLALRGLRTRVIDRRPHPGHAVHTTGLLVKEVAERWDVPARLTRRVRGVRLYSPNLKQLDLHAPGYYFLATDTAALMTWFAEEARRAGARVDFGRAYRGARRCGGGFELADSPLRTRFLIGADGPRSAVARNSGLSSNRAFLLGVEAEYEGVRGVDPDRLHCFVDYTLARGYIGWAVSGVHGITQIGLALTRPLRPDLSAFERKLAPLFDFSQARRIGHRGGLIPCGGRVARFAAQRVALVGDAAGLVSPLTGGGIHTALESGWRAAHAVADWLQDGGPEPAHALAASYPRFVWKRALRRIADVAWPNAIFDAALSTRLARRAADAIYFHRRGSGDVEDDSTSRRAAEEAGNR
ncbi:MAG: NAD(P)/FAD-dependent oxidoreductase [Betaproteobacteria bacterium]